MHQNQVLVTLTTRQSRSKLTNRTRVMSSTTMKSLKTKQRKTQTSPKFPSRMSKPKKCKRTPIQASPSLFRL
jgi:hypothetical protein